MEELFWCEREMSGCAQWIVVVLAIFSNDPR